jgi:hypothetical protein
MMLRSVRNKRILQVRGLTLKHADWTADAKKGLDLARRISLLSLVFCYPRYSRSAPKLRLVSSSSRVL